MLDVLVVAPHPDDAELGMGGTILKLRAEGRKVGVLELTNGEPTPFGTVEKRAAETAAATKILGLDWRGSLGLPNRSVEPTLEARRLLASKFRELKPRWIFAPYWIDSHPDHVAATQLVEAARFWSKLTKSDMPHEPHFPAKIVYYLCIHLRQVVQPAFVVDISPYWPQKKAAVECYHSQFFEGRPADQITITERLEHEAGYWGWMIGARYGEAFATRDPLGLQSFDGVL